MSAQRGFPDMSNELTLNTASWKHVLNNVQLIK